MSCHTFRPCRGVPRATVEHMPFIGHRNCSQWGQPAVWRGREMTEEERTTDAREGSARLGEAVRRAIAG